MLRAPETPLRPNVDRRWEVVAPGLDYVALFASSGGRLRIGAPGSSGVPVEAAPHQNGTALHALSGYDHELSELDGHVLLWWPADLGRQEINATLTRGPRSSHATVSWPPRRCQLREHRRVTLDVPVWIASLDSNDVAEGRTCNISAGGVGVALDPVAAWCIHDTGVVVCVTLDGAPFTAAGTIRRVDGGRFVSVRFDVISAAAESRVVAAVVATEPRRAL